MDTSSFSSPTNSTNGNSSCTTCSILDLLTNTKLSINNKETQYHILSTKLHSRNNQILQRPRDHFSSVVLVLGRHHQAWLT
jgi:hypothetical protein